MRKKFSPKRNLNKTNTEKVDVNSPVVYKMFNQSGSLLYIGIAKRGRGEERLMEHVNKKGEKIPGATQFQSMPVKTVEDARKIEKKLIKSSEPKFNKEK